MNPYPELFLHLLAETDGPVLDCGSGGRKHPRIISLEPTAHPNNTLRGDGMKLPFRNGSFRLILSQAVLEHVHQPRRYIDEIIRVLAPGGLLYIEAAFMQPVHQAPTHFFNFTGFGLAEVCSGLHILDQGAFGTLAESWDWIGREVGAVDVLGAEACQLVRDQMAKVDAAMTSEQVWAVAPAVWLLGRKQ